MKFSFLVIPVSGLLCVIFTILVPLFLHYSESEYKWYISQRFAVQQLCVLILEIVWGRREAKSVLCFYLGLLSFRGQTKIKQEVHRISLVSNLLVAINCFYWVTDLALEILMGRLTWLTIPIPIKIIEKKVRPKL